MTDTIPLLPPDMPTEQEIINTVTGPLSHTASLIRRINAANGWGTEFSFQVIPIFVALIHTEIVEAQQEREVPARNRELGDVIVRALDLAELVQPGALPASQEQQPVLEFVSGTLESRLLDLHAATAAVTEDHRKIADEASARTMIVAGLWFLAVETELLIREYGGDIHDILRDILLKNRTRGFRHGGRRT